MQADKLRLNQDFCELLNVLACRGRGKHAPLQQSARAFDLPVKTKLSKTRRAPTLPDTRTRQISFTVPHSLFTGLKMFVA